MIPRVLAVLALFLVAAPTVQAEPPLVDREHLKLAAQHWGGWPPCGYPSLSTIPLAEAQRIGETKDIIALAEWGGPERLCRIRYVDTFYDSTRRNRRYDLRCAVMLHEMGHLHGRKHSTDPNDIMAPKVTVVPRICRVNETRRWNGCWKYRLRDKRQACRVRWLVTP